MANVRVKVRDGLAITLTPEVPGDQGTVYRGPKEVTISEEEAERWAHCVEILPTSKPAGGKE